MRSLVLPSLLAIGLVAAPAAGAATLKLPSPAAGEVAVVAAPVTGKATPKVGGVPKGVAVTGGVSKHVAVFAVVRPRGAGKAGVTVRGKLGRPSSASAVLGATPPAALATVACPGASVLGRVLRRGAGAPAAADLQRLGAVLAARLCGKDVGDGGIALLVRLKLDAPTPPHPSVALPAAPTASAPPTTPAPAPSAAAPAPPAATPPASSGAPQCSNGKDDDGDGQVDALGRGATFFDPGCANAADTTEASERTVPATCGDGLTMRATRNGFRADMDGDQPGCPGTMAKGVVDLKPALGTCIVPSWDDRMGQASCSNEADAMVVAAGPGHRWTLVATAAGDLCGTSGTLVGYTADGQAWERTGPIADPKGVCAAGPPAGTNACNNGIDDDFDGQVDFAGLPGAGADPGCTSAGDATEDSEQVFPSTGCWPIVAADPDDATLAWIYLLPNGAGASCPTMTEAWVSFDAIEATACASQPYWSQVAAGTCAVQGGDVHVAGGSGTALAVAVQLDHAVGCDVYAPGQIDMRDGTGTLHEGVTDDGYFDAGDVLRLCP
jgi:hypothetical protein